MCEGLQCAECGHSLKKYDEVFKWEEMLFCDKACVDRFLINDGLKEIILGAEY